MSLILFKKRSVTTVAAAIALLTLSACTSKPASADGGTGAPPAAGGGGRAGRGGGGDVPVTITKVAQQNVPIEIEVVGNVEAYSAITIRAQVGGELTKVYVSEGDYVKVGQPLFTIDKRPTEAVVAQTQANLLRQAAVQKQLEAQKARDEAQGVYAKNQADRYQKLFVEGIMSKDQTEQTAAAAGVALQTVAADQAAIDSAKADIKATQAQLDNVKVQLGYSEISSPINGRTGTLLAKQGSLVTANAMDLMTINQVQPIFVTFSVPESNLPEIKKYMAQTKLKVFAKSQEQEGPPEEGVLSFVDNTVDTTTGTIKLKGKFENPSLKLWPGQFVRVTLRLTTRQGALVLPNQAVQTGQDGTYVYVVKDDMKVESRKVETGPRADQNFVIESGLQAGETVVLDGQLRLAPGSKVIVRDPSGAGAGGRRGGASRPAQKGDQAPKSQ
jgi:membrane fusion protein, multidrug efflux system